MKVFIAVLITDTGYTMEENNSGKTHTRNQWRLSKKTTIGGIKIIGLAKKTNMKNILAIQ